MLLLLLLRSRHRKLFNPTRTRSLRLVSRSNSNKRTTMLRIMPPLMFNPPLPRCYRQEISILLLPPCMHQTFLRLLPIFPTCQLDWRRFFSPMARIFICRGRRDR